MFSGLGAVVRMTGFSCRVFAPDADARLLSLIELSTLSVWDEPLRARPARVVSAILCPSSLKTPRSGSGVNVDDSDFERSIGE
jgi:hypothetical protein